MKTLLKTTLSVIMALTVMSAVAQPQRGQGNRNQERPTPEQQATRISEQMAKELDLTAEQKQQIYDLELTAAEKRPNYRARQNQERPGDEEMKEMREEMKKWMDDHQKSVKEVLTAEQYEQWSKVRKKRMRPMRNMNSDSEEGFIDLDGNTDKMAKVCPMCDKDSKKCRCGGKKAQKKQ